MLRSGQEFWSLTTAVASSVFGTERVPRHVTAVTVLLLCKEDE